MSDLSEGVPQPRITVAVCTHNRYDHLPACIESLAGQDLDGDSFEILVIDNSTDLAARDAFERAARHPHNLRTVHVQTPGLSIARNAALREARAPLVAYIDDDAVADAGWLRAIVAAFDRHRKADVVFGPVIPIWPDGQRPAWMDASFEAAFTVLDLGETPRSARPEEHGFGTNIAFRVAAVEKVGGFPENLGRVRGALLSGEEMAVQARLREAGSGAYYAAKARVRHHVQADRLRQSWLIARFAWQGVSDRLEGVSWSGAAHAIDVLSRSPHGPAIGEVLAGLACDRPADGKAVAAKAATARALVGLLLAMGDMRDVDIAHAAAALRPAAPPPPPEAEATSEAYRWAPSIRPGADLIIVEGNPGHPYLAEPFRQALNTQMVNIDLRGLRDHCAEYPGTFAALRGRRAKVLFLTLDSHVYWWNTAEFLRHLRTADSEIWGVLHRLPDTAEAAQALQEAASRMKGIFVLAEELARQLHDRYGIANAHYLPHVATKAPLVRRDRWSVRRSLGIPEDRVVFSFLGELRDGKGFGLLLDSLENAPPVLRERGHFLFAGRAGEEAIAKCREVVQRNGLSAAIDLHPGDGDTFAVVPDSDFANRLAATDWLCLLYQGPQRSVMSGALPDVLSLGGRVIATRDSLVGRLTESVEGGLVLSDETPPALVRLMEEAMDSPAGHASDRLKTYLDSIRPAHVSDRIRHTVFSERREEGIRGVA